MIKRAFAIGASLIGLVLLAVPFALIALAIKLDFHTLLSWRRVLD